MFRIACYINTGKKYLEDRSQDIAEFYTFDKAMEVAKGMCEDTYTPIKNIKIEYEESLSESINTDYLD
tara:strand:+ start:241 stop:444 length:204 start_codon:yes stop_codon:yes gene_type:complete